MQFYFDSNVEFHNVITKEKTTMNLSNIFESTDFVHASGTKEELQVAEFLKAQCEALGVPARLEAFRVAMGEIESAHLYAGNGSCFHSRCKR